MNSANFGIEIITANEVDPENVVNELEDVSEHDIAVDVESDLEDENDRENFNYSGFLDSDTDQEEEDRKLRKRENDPSYDGFFRADEEIEDSLCYMTMSYSGEYHLIRELIHYLGVYKKIHLKCNNHSVYKKLDSEKLILMFVKNNTWNVGTVLNKTTIDTEFFNPKFIYSNILDDTVGPDGLTTPWKYRLKAIATFRPFDPATSHFLQDYRIKVDKCNKDGTKIGKDIVLNMMKKSEFKTEDEPWAKFQSENLEGFQLESFPLTSQAVVRMETLPELEDSGSNYVPLQELEASGNSPIPLPELEGSSSNTIPLPELEGSSSNPVPLLDLEANSNNPVPLPELEDSGSNPVPLSELKARGSNIVPRQEAETVNRETGNVENEPGNTNYLDYID